MYTVELRSHDVMYEAWTQKKFSVLVHAVCIDRESCDTRVKGHPKEFHVIVDHERVPKIVPICLYMVCNTGLLMCEDHTGN